VEIIKVEQVFDQRCEKGASSFSSQKKIITLDGNKRWGCGIWRRRPASEPLAQVHLRVRVSDIPDSTRYGEMSIYSNMVVHWQT